jgi:hypothetical protein
MRVSRSLKAPIIVLKPVAALMDVYRRFSSTICIEIARLRRWASFSHVNVNGGSGFAIQLLTRRLKRAKIGIGILFVQETEKLRCATYSTQIFRYGKFLGLAEGVDTKNDDGP